MSISRIIVAAIAVIIIIILLSVVVRSLRSTLGRVQGTSTEATPTPIPGTSPSPTPTPPVNKASLTSTEAVQLAYVKAKAWNPNAVLWFESPLWSQMDTDWLRTDSSQAWDVTFADPATLRMYAVQTNGSAIALAGETGTLTGNPVQDSYPKDAPEITMAAAGNTAVAHGAPSEEEPTVAYTIDNANETYNGRPVWQFSYSNGITYFVDALNGEYLGSDSIHEGKFIL